MHLAYIWIVSHLSVKNYQNWWKFDEVLTKTNLLSFFWDTVYISYLLKCSHYVSIIQEYRNTVNFVYLRYLQYDVRAYSASCQS